MTQTIFPGGDVLLSRLVPLFQRLSGWRLWTVFTAGFILAVEIIVSGMGLLLKGMTRRPQRADDVVDAEYRVIDKQALPASR